MIVYKGCNKYFLYMDDTVIKFEKVPAFVSFYVDFSKQVN